MSSVSVIMGVYRPERAMLIRAVDSILLQTKPVLELVICDDGSEDGTYEFLTEWAGRDGRLLVLRHEVNRGLAAALNTCLDVAGGDYIARQDADDYSAPERLAVQAGFLDENQRVDFAGSAVNLYDDGGVWAVKAFPERPEKRDFLFAMPFLHGSMMFRRSALLAHRYDEGRLTRRAEDYELLMRMCAAGLKGYNLPAPYYCYRDVAAGSARRKYRYRLDEAAARAKGFHCLGLLPGGAPYIVKPLIVGLIPKNILQKMKKRHYRL